MRTISQTQKTVPYHISKRWEKRQKYDRVFLTNSEVHWNWYWREMKIKLGRNKINCLKIRSEFQTLSWFWFSSFKNNELSKSENFNLTVFIVKCSFDPMFEGDICDKSIVFDIAGCELSEEGRDSLWEGIWCGSSWYNHCICKKIMP